MEMIELLLRDCSSDVDQMGILADENDVPWRCLSVDCGSDCDSEVKISVDE